jgi:pimeloyl-ACP methyl ester carboxylesterase
MPPIERIKNQHGLLKALWKSRKGENVVSDFVLWNSQPLDTWAKEFAEGDFVDLSGRRTHFVKRGQGEPVLLIHGFNLDWHTWIRNIDPLAAHFKVYALDLWGQGFSTREPLDYGYALFSEQVEMFMDALGIERASLVGHSMGGGTAIVWSLHNRERVEKLGLLGSTGIPNPLPFRSKIFRMPGIAEFLLSLPTDRIRNKNLADFWVRSRDLLSDGYYQEFTRSQKVQGSMEALLSILRKDFFDTLSAEIRALGQLNIPTLVIWGREDQILPPRRAEELHRLLPGSRLEILDEAGHLANFDRPTIFVRLVIDFLQERI